MIHSENNTILRAILGLIRQSSAGKLSARSAHLVLPALMLLFASQAAHARECLTDGPHYQLESDSVEWRMKIRSGESCVRGVRFKYVYNATVKPVTPPRSGQVTLIGPGFSYTAKSDFHGEDSFIVGVSGSKNHASGISTIRVVVSVAGAQQAVLASDAHF